MVRKKYIDSKTNKQTNKKNMLKHRSEYYQDEWNLAIYHFKLSQKEEV